MCDSLKILKHPETLLKHYEILIKHHETLARRHETLIQYHETLTKHHDTLIKHRDTQIKHRETLEAPVKHSQFNAAISALGVVFPVMLAIRVLVKLCGSVTELLILVIWIFFPDLT